MKRIILFIAVLACLQSSYASHLSGGHISYEHISGNNYFVRLEISSANNSVIGNSYLVSAISVSTSQNFTTSLPKAQTIYGPYACCAVSSNCSFSMTEYSGVVSLPNVAADWKFAVALNARNAVQSVSGGALYLEATLDNLNTAINNSARISSFKPFGYHQYGVLQNVAINAIDPDGDSLNYTLITARGGNVNVPTPLTYQSPYTPTQPLNSLSTISLNPTSGIFSFTGGQIGNYVAAIQIDEYRSGVLIASSVYDSEINIVLDTTTSNNNPIVNGASLQNVVTIDACPTSILNINLITSDINVSDSSYIAWDSSIANATFTVTPGQNENGLFSWSPDTSDVSPTPYLVSFRVTDNNCNLLGQNVYTYLIYVNQCSPDSVWAGDANADFTCNNYDVLNIGIANSASGAVRPGASTNWQAEWCPNWTTSFINNIDYKHADCNGDGTVNNLDLAAVTANYGQIHFKNAQLGQYKTLGLPDLYCDLTNVQAHKGSSISVPIMLGTSSSLMNDFYGISATVELLNAQTSAPIAVSKNVSWIGNASNSFEFEKNLAANKSAFTFVRNDQTNLSAQQGQIGEISFPIDAASVTGSKVIVQFSDIKMIKNTGEEIVDYNVMSDTITILAPNAISEIEQGFSVNVYPNPTNSKITISLNIDKTQSYEIALYDVVGRLIDNNIFSGKLNAGVQNLELDLSKQAVGQYLLEIQSESGKTVLPLQRK